jgi:hypothetical protein
VFTEAVRTGAAEVRLEPAIDRLAIWLLIQGQAVEGQAMPLWFAAPVIEHLKFMAGFKQEPATMSQHGTIRLTILDRNVDIDVRTSHGPHGECILLQFNETGGPAQPPAGERGLITLLSLQQAEGWFGSSGGSEDEVERVIADAGHDPAKWLDEVRINLPNVTGGPSDSDRVTRATLALLAFTILFREHESLWRRAHLKGLRFIAASLRMGAREVEAWVNERTDRIRSVASARSGPAPGTS